MTISDGQIAPLSGAIVRLKEFDIVKTLIEQKDIPKDSVGTIVHMYENYFHSKFSCIVEFGDLEAQRNMMVIVGFWENELELVQSFYASEKL